jgi:hypothetical protein
LIDAMATVQNLDRHWYHPWAAEAVQVDTVGFKMYRFYTSKNGVIK